MAAPDNIVEKRLANALFSDAQASSGADKLLKSGGRLGLGMAKKMMGGLWVGGTAYLTRDAVEFQVNGLNAMAHANPETLNRIIPLGAISRAQVRPAMVTQIIDIHDRDGGVFSIRCYNAKSFAEAINRAAAG
jgi:hypothetical protein